MSTTPLTRGGKLGLAVALRSNRVAPIAVFVALTALTCVFFWKLVFVGLILSSYDLIAYFYPLKAYTSSAIASGRLPLWNPELFMGVPFLANIQAAIFYPPNVADLGLMPPDAVAVSVVSHVVLAGLFTYAFLRFSVRLGRPASFLGALVFMFSGFLGQQVGHINQLNASVWLPLLLVLFDWAHSGRSLWRSLLGGSVLAFILLAGHTQESFLTLCAFAGYAAFRVLLMPAGGHDRASPAASRIGEVLRNVLIGVQRRAFLLATFAAILVVGVALAAVQLLPTYELSAASIRAGGLRYGEAISFSLPPFLAVQSLLPGYVSNPFSEYIGYIGVAPLLLAILAVIRLPKNRFMWFALALAAVALVLSVGGYDPLYPRLYDHVPGFKLFRVPARWLYVYTFAMTVLVALGADVVCRDKRVRGEWTFRSRMRTTLLFVGTLCIIAALLWSVRLVFLPKEPVTPVLWLLFGGLATVLILMGLWQQHPRLLALLLACLFFAELLFASQGLEFNRALPRDVYTLMRPPIPQLLTLTPGSRMLSSSYGNFMPGDERDIRDMLRGVLSDDAINDFLVTSKYNQTLAPNTPLRLGLTTIDGYDGGVLPLQRYAELKKVVADKSQGGASPAGQADAPLRLQLGSLPSTKVLGELGVKYVVADKTRDIWHDGVYFDLSMTATAEPGVPAVFTSPPDFRATSIRLLSHLTDTSDIGPGEVAAKVIVQAYDGSEQAFLLRNGTETAGLPEQNTGPVRDLAAGKVLRLPFGRSYWTGMSFSAPTPVRTVRAELLSSSSTLEIDGMSLVDDRTGVSEPMISNGQLKRIYSGDVKVYENLQAKAELYLARRIDIARTPAQELESLARDLGDRVVLPGTPNVDWRVLATMDADRAGEPDGLRQAGADPPSQVPAESNANSDSVQTLVDRPELHRAKVTARQPAFLIFTQSYYPGWYARLDGEPVEILRANHLFQGIYVPAGSHTVEFFYRPSSVRLGLLISLAASAAVVGMLVLTILTRWASKLKDRS